MTRSDADLLSLLDMQAAGLTYAEMSHKMGMTIGAVAGQLRRIASDTGEPDKHDGTMPKGWWKAGLERQARQ